MTVKLAKPEHKVVYADLCALVAKHVGDDMTPLDVLAIASNMIGKLIAMQDQRVTTKQIALQVLMENLEAGNAEVLDKLANETKGRA